MRAQPDPSDSGVRFGILGSLRIEVDGIEVGLASPKLRVLVAALLIDVGEVVSIARLAETLWGDDQPVDAARASRTYISRVRRALSETDGERARSMIETRPTGYALVVDPRCIDAWRFEAMVEAARVAPSPEVAAKLLRDALALWRGDALCEFDDERVNTEAARLTELRRVAVELRADAMLRLARYQEAAGELEVATARNPLRERLHGQLMVALYRSGRQADALGVYRELRRELIEGLGMEPSVQLRQLENAILQQADDLPWPAPPDDGDATGRDEAIRSVTAKAAGWSEAGWSAAGWSEVLTSFVGRENDQRSVAAALRANRVVVLTGVGGVGKTRLARRVAGEMSAEYTEGVVVCDLVGAEHSEAVAEVVATALGAIPGPHVDPRDVVVEALGGRQMLLVLDNCEHVVDEVSELIDRICRRCRGVDVLVTSRRSLGVPGAQMWPVMPFATDDSDSTAIELFRERALSADPTFEMTDRETVIEICRRLDGLPLAIELAAARVRSMNPADIAARLDHRFEVVAHQARGAAPRHQSLRAVLEWSYELLSADARILLDRLATFVGGFQLDDAVLVCADAALPAGALRNRFTELVDHSLVEVDHTGRYARYRLLESVRAFGEQHLDERGELGVWRRCHGEHFVALAEEAAGGLRGPQEAHWVRILDTEFSNLRAAHSWASTTGHVDLALRLSAALHDYAYYRLHDEVHAWTLRSLELPGAGDHRQYPAAAIAGAVGQMQRGDLGLARESGEQVLRSAYDDHVCLRALQLLAEIALYQGRLDDADELGRDLVERARTADAADYDEALGHLYRVHAAAYSGRHAQAREELRSGSQVASSTEAPALRAGYLYLEGEIELDADPAAARAALHQAIEIADATRNRFVAGIARVAIATLEARHGSPTDALGAFGEVVEHWRRCGDWVHVWTTLRNLAVLFERVDASESAAVLVGALQTASTGAQAFGDDARRLEETDTALRGSLGPDDFAAKVEQGRAMTDADAVGFALDRINALLAAVAL